jgi:hypothetical protein
MEKYFIVNGVKNFATIVSHVALLERRHYNQINHRLVVNFFENNK